MRIFRLLCWLWLLPWQAQASHIAGGELTYRCLGGNEYEVTYNFYRDCLDGADFPSVMRLYAYEGNAPATASLLTPDDSAPDTIVTGDFSDLCFVPSPPFCFTRLSYSDTLTVIPSGKPLHLLVSDCCRNAPVNNVVSAGSTVFTATITVAAQVGCNQSVLPLSWPPTVVDVGNSFSLDFSLPDPDGDSLSYRLCTPYRLGDNQLDTLNFLANLNPVNYSQGYNINNLLNGAAGNGDDLTIDPATGEVSGIGLFQGFYLIGICVAEYRDGELINETRREIQLIVTDYGPPVALFSYRIFPCNYVLSLEALQPNVYDYAWYIDGVLFDSSDVPTELQVMLDTGTYEVALVAGANLSCPDTLITSIEILPSEEPPVLGFEYELISACEEEFTIQVTDSPIDTSFSPESWVWIFPGSPPSFEYAPVFTGPTGLDLFVSLNLFYGEGCVVTAVEYIRIDSFVPPDFSAVYSACPGDTLSVDFTELGDSIDLSWVPPPLSDDPTTTLIFPPDTTTYTLTLTENGTGCTAQQTITTNPIAIPVGFDWPVDTVACAAELELTSPFAETYWFYDAATGIPFDTAQTVQVNSLISSVVVTQSPTPEGCLITDSLLIVDGSFDLRVPEQLSSCQSARLAFPYSIRPIDFYSLTVDADSNLYELTTDSVFFEAAASTTLTLTASNLFGCRDTASIDLEINPGNALLPLFADPTVIECGDSTRLEAAALAGATYQWLPTDSLRSPTAAVTIAAPAATTTYEAVRTDADGCVARNTVLVEVLPPLCGPPGIFLPNTFTPNGDGLNDTWQVHGPNIDRMLLQVYDRWGGLVFTATQPTDGWDGTRNGQLLPPDIFGYHLRAFCTNGAVYEQQGKVTLVR